MMQIIHKNCALSEKQQINDVVEYIKIQNAIYALAEYSFLYRTLAISFTYQDLATM